MGGECDKCASVTAPSRVRHWHIVYVAREFVEAYMVVEGRKNMLDSVKCELMLLFTVNARK